MPATRRLFRLAVLLLVAVIAASCGGGDDTKSAARSESCPNEIPFRATFLPSGFRNELQEGAGRDGAPKGVIVFHYEGSGDKVIDVFRGGRRTKFEKGEAVRVLGGTARIKEISGGFAARLPLGRGTCSKYQYEAFGVSKEDMTKLVLGLRRVATKQSEAEE
ncbi:MAG: hypothetical protein WD826_12380 [Actinomycetota bacterium]